MKKFEKIIIFIIISFSILIFSSKTYSHWIYATHEYMINPLAMNVLAREGKALYIELLKTEVTVNGKERTYLDLIIQGVRDADIRANGIYVVDGHCKDTAKEECPEDEKVYNDIPEWIVGDHGYNCESCRGFYSNPEDNFFDERIKELQKNFYDPKIERLKVALGCAKEDRICFIDKLLAIAQDSNAATMAEFFWEKAINEWKMNRAADAMYNLGIAIHLVQDASVPHHTKLIRNEIDKNHGEYDKYVWENYLREGDFEPKIEGIYERLTAKEWVKRNAEESCKFKLYKRTQINNVIVVKASELEAVKINDPLSLQVFAPELSALDSVSLGVSSTVGMIVNFIDSIRAVKTQEKTFY